MEVDESKPLISRGSIDRESEIGKADPKHSINPIKSLLNARPKYVEVGYFLYYLASSATAPLVEQFSKTEINKGYDDYRNYIQYAALRHPDWSSLEPSVKTETCNPSNHTNSMDSILENTVSSKTSTWLLFLDLALTVPAVFTTLIICSFGDKHGRKLGLVLSSAGGAIRGCLFLLTIYLKWPPMIFLLAAFIDGLSGSSLTFSGSCLAYIADTSSKESRAMRFIFLQTLNTFASAAAHLGTGYMIDMLGYNTSFWVVAAIHILNNIYIITLIPESKYTDEQEVSAQYPNLRRRSSLQILKDNTVMATKRAFGSFSVLTQKTSYSYGRLKLGLLLSAFITHCLVSLGTSGAKTLFMLAPPFCWNSIQIGYYNAFSNILHGLAGLAGVWILTKCIKESTVAILGSLSSTLGQFVYAIARNGLTLYIAILVQLGNNVILPLVRAIMSKLIDPGKQGALFATVFSMETICDVVSGAWINAVYSATLHTFGGIVFIACTAVYLISTVLLCIYYCVERTHPDNKTSRESLIRQNIRYFSSVKETGEKSESCKIEFLSSTNEKNQANVKTKK